MAIVLLSGLETKTQVVVYSLDTKTFEVREKLLDRQVAHQQVISGLGDYLKTGWLFRKRKIFIANFCDDISLYLWIDNRCLDLLNDDIEIRRKAVFIPKTKIQVLKNGIVVWEAYYKYHMQGEFPPEDLFEYMPDNSLESRVRTFLRYRDRRDGVNTTRTGYLKEIDLRAREWIKNERGFKKEHFP